MSFPRLPRDGDKYIVYIVEEVRTSLHDFTGQRSSQASESLITKQVTLDKSNFLHNETTPHLFGY